MTRRRDKSLCPGLSYRSPLDCREASRQLGNKTWNLTCLVPKAPLPSGLPRRSGLATKAGRGSLLRAIQRAVRQFRNPKSEISGAKLHFWGGWAVKNHVTAYTAMRYRENKHGRTRTAAHKSASLGASQHESASLRSPRPLTARLRRVEGGPQADPRSGGSARLAGRSRAAGRLGGWSGRSSGSRRHRA